MAAILKIEALGACFVVAFLFVCFCLIEGACSYRVCGIDVGLLHVQTLLLAIENEQCVLGRRLSGPV